MNELKQMLVCSGCGMTSGRRWNILRHINNRHDGDGEVLGFMQYVLSTNKGEIPLPTYSRPAGFQGTDAGKRKNSPSEVLLAHARIDSGNTCRKLSDMNEKIREPLSLRIETCEKCLAYKYYWRIHFRQGSTEQTDHVCDFGWMLDNQSILGDKQAVIELLRQRAAQELAELVRNISGGHLGLMATKWEEDRPNKEMIAACTTGFVLSLSAINPNDPRLPILRERTARMLRAIRQEQRRVVSGKPFKWLDRAVAAGLTDLSHDELVEFLSISLSTILKLDFRGSNYYLLLLIYGPGLPVK